MFLLLFLRMSVEAPSAPTNTSALTATSLGLLPATVSQNVYHGGTTHTVWYKFTAPTGAIVIGAFGFGSLDYYHPTVRAYTGPASAPVQVLSIAGENRPIQFPTTPGVEYFLEFTPNAGNPQPAVLSVSVLKAPCAAVQAGDFVAIADAAGHRSAVYAPGAQFTVRRFIDIPWDSQASSAANLANGNALLVDEANTRVVLYDRAFTFLLAPAITIDLNSVLIAANRTLNKFVVVTDNNPFSVAVLSAAGVVENTYNTGLNITPDGVQISNDGTVLFYNNGSFGEAIRRWDLAGGAAMADFAAGVTGYKVYDMLALSDGGLLVGYWSLGSVVPDHFFVRRYSSAGAVVQTFDYGTAYTRTATRITYGADYPETFGLWGHRDTVPVDGTHQISVFQTIRVSDGEILNEAQGAEFDELAGAFDDGVYAYSMTPTPFARFGNANSCPFLVVPVVPGEVLECVLERPSVGCWTPATPSVGCATPETPAAACWSPHSVNRMQVGLK